MSVASERDRDPDIFDQFSRRRIVKGDHRGCVHGGDRNWHKAACAAFCSLSATVKVPKASYVRGRTYAFHYHSDHAARSDAAIADHHRCRARRKRARGSPSRSLSHFYAQKARKFGSCKFTRQMRANCTLRLGRSEFSAIGRTTGEKESSRRKTNAIYYGGTLWSNRRLVHRILRRQ